MPEISDEVFEIHIGLLETEIARRAEIATLDLQGLVNARRAAGMTRDEIAAELLAGDESVLNQIRKSFGLGVKTNLESISHYTYQTIYDGEPILSDAEFNWVLTKEDNCPTCIERAGMGSRSMGEWQAIGVPGAGTTICRMNCGCRLVPSSVQVKPLDKREPIETI